MADAIKGFKGKFRFLSNFWPAEVEFEGQVYKATEFAYQAAKTTDQRTRDYISTLEKPGEAKKFARAIKVRDNWKDIRLQVMEDLTRQKFTKHLDLQAKLLATGDAYLEEKNSWFDTFFGVCNGVGENHLGKILMKVRAEIQSTKPG